MKIKFKVDDTHNVVFDTDTEQINCSTCGLSHAVCEIIKVMVDCTIYSASCDGTEIRRI